MSSSGPFSRRMLILIGVVAVGSLVLGLGLAVFGDKVSRAPISDANAFSRSAVGHKAFVELLERLDIPVVVSRYESAKKAKKGAVLILAEPRPNDDAVKRARALASDADTVLMILPKWSSVPQAKRKQWVASVSLYDKGDIQRVASEVLAVDLQVVRPERVDRFTTDELGITPQLRYPQLLRSESVEPIVATEDGILLGQVNRTQGVVWVLSDPDVIATHSIGRGDNARFALAVVDHLRSADGAVVFDETVHGFQIEPSVWRALLEFPLVLATLQILCAALLFLWSGIRRFGAPRSPRPAIEPGKRFLIDNTAALLQFGGHTAHALRRYYNTTVRDVARNLNAPDLDDAKLEAWLERVGSNKGVKLRLADVRSEVAAVTAVRRVQPRSVVLAANRLYYWKQEMLHGPAGNSRSG